jgi:RNA polymerase sigma-70 factor, ECF subfamily
VANTFSELPLTALIRACAETGEDAAWESFVERTRRIIGLTLLRSVRRWAEPDPALVEDLIQETYLKLCTNRCNALRRLDARSDEAVLAYLKVVAANVALDYFRAAYSQKRYPSKIIPLEESAGVSIRADWQRFGRAVIPLSEPISSTMT